MWLSLPPPSAAVSRVPGAHPTASGSSLPWVQWPGCAAGPGPQVPQVHSCTLAFALRPGNSGPSGCLANSTHPEGRGQSQVAWVLGRAEPCSPSVQVCLAARPGDQGSLAALLLGLGCRWPACLVPAGGAITGSVGGPGREEQGCCGSGRPQDPCCGWSPVPCRRQQAFCGRGLGIGQNWGGPGLLEGRELHPEARRPAGFRDTPHSVLPGRVGRCAPEESTVGLCVWEPR